MPLKRKIFMLIAGALVLAAPIVGWAMHLGTTTLGHPEGAAGPRAAEDVRNTLHNLSTSNIMAGININGTATSTAEVCVFCHTPHGANPNTIGTPGAPPLWNRTVGASGSYTIYTSPNFDGTNSGQPQGVSLACLSCHDGTIALDSLINMPGSGGFRVANETPPGGTTNLIQPAGGSAFLSAGTNTMNNAQRTDTGPNYEQILGGAAPFPNLTTDLSDDHPISMEIPSTGAGPDPQFDQLINNSGAPDPSGLTLLTRTGTVNQDKRDTLRAYPAAGGGRPAGGKYIECASCHNPHAPRPMFLRLPSRYDSALALPSGGGATTVNDLLGNGDATLLADNPNAGSLICISCHQK
ncbi:MAG TPA: hypothetical protein VMN77_10650 [Nitrospiria bacterium]|jgi:cytochrome c553|nr:hypothetical protein [Nitrospiria bacterium]